MLKKIEDLNFYELLEVDPRASAQDIHRAYERSRRIYDPNSIALYSLFSQEETEKIHQRIEDAYRTLMYEENRRKYDALLRDRREIPEPEQIAPKYMPRFVPPQPAHLRQDEPRRAPAEPLPAAPVPAEPAPAQTLPPALEALKPAPAYITEFSGSSLKVLREQRNLTIRALADITKIGSRYLEYIEEENYKKLPARPYLRGFLALYAKALGFEPNRIVTDYFKRYDGAMNKPR